MFSFRDTLAASLLGVQLPTNDSSNNSLSGAKKPKKKAHKKKSKKKKVETQDDDDNDYESISSDAAGNDDEEDVIASFGAAVPSTGASAAASKKAAIMAQQYESTQIEDQIHQMIRLLAGEFNLDKAVVNETVNRMFESGLQYDNREAVIKHLPLKSNASRSIDVKDESGLQFQSAASSPYPVSPVPHNAAVSRPATRTTRTFSGATPETASTGISAVDADAAVALAKLTTPSSAKPTAVASQAPAATSSQAIAHTNAGKAKHGKEIEAVPTQPAPQAPIGTKSSVQVTHAEPALHSMKEKLDYVAAYSRTNLYDSLAALCSWASVSLPASAEGGQSADQEKQQKMDAFFQSQALEILLTTMFSDEAQQLTSRADVKGAFQALLQHVLLGHSESAAGSGNVQHITDTLAQVVSQICSLRTAQVVPAFSGDSVRGSQVLAQQIAACVKKLYSQLSFHVGSSASETNSALSGASADKEDGNDELFGKLEAIDAQLHALEKSAAKKGASASEVASEKVQNMFLSREIHCDKLQLCLESVKKASVQKAPVTVSRTAVSMPQVPNANASELTRSVVESSASIERILLSECNLLAATDLAHPAASTASSIQSKHQQSHHINSHFDRLCYERDAKLGTLSNELSASNMRVQELSAHKQRLLEQVQLCDQELGNLSARTNALSTELSNATFYYQQQLDQLVQTGNSVRKSLQAHDQVNSLVTAVRNFENKFAEALLHEHAVHVAAANGGPQSPASAHSAGGRNTTILTSASFGAQKNAVGGAATGTSAIDASEEAKAQQAERVLLLANTLKSYVAAEAQCIHFLSERIAPAETKLATLRKELLAYSALSMKGAVVQQAEASVKQLETEVAEDQQTVGQLQQNVAETLAQVKALQDSLAPPVPARNGKYVAPGTKVAPAAPVAPVVVIAMPSAELAQIVQSCNSAHVTAAPAILAHAGKIATPAPASAPAPAVSAQLAAPAVVSGPPAVATNAPVASAAKAPASSAGKPREPRDTKAASTGRAERGEKGPDNRRGGRDGNSGRGKVETKSEVDTSNAIQLLEKSCLQKASVGGVPAKAAAPVRTERPTPKVEPSAPVASVWKVPTSGGVQESKSAEPVKSLKEIQEEQRNEKSRAAQQKAHKKQDDLAAAAAFLLSPNKTSKEAKEAKVVALEVVDETKQEVPAIAAVERPVAVVDMAASATAAVVAEAPPAAIVADSAPLTHVPEDPSEASLKVEKAAGSPTPKKAKKAETAEKVSKTVKQPPAKAPAKAEQQAEQAASTVEQVSDKLAETAEESTGKTATPKKTPKAAKQTPGKADQPPEAHTVEHSAEKPAEKTAEKGTSAKKAAKTPKQTPVKAEQEPEQVPSTVEKAGEQLAEKSATAKKAAKAPKQTPVKTEQEQESPTIASIIDLTPKKPVKTTAEASATANKMPKAPKFPPVDVGNVVPTVAADQDNVTGDVSATPAKAKTSAKKTPSKANPVIIKQEPGDVSIDAEQVDSVDPASSETPAKAAKTAKPKSAAKNTPAKATPVIIKAEVAALEVPTSPELYVDTTAAAAPSTPPGSSTQPVDPRSPLVEFHCTYPSAEEASHERAHHSTASRAHDINPMQQLSPLVEHHSIYPEEEEALEEVDEASDTEGNGAQGTPYIGTTLPGALGNTASSTFSGTSTGTSKMHDINPMARASPGKGIVRIKLDMSQVSEGEDSLVISPSMAIGKSASDDGQAELAE